MAMWISWHQTTILDFNGARGNRTAVESTEPCANHLHLAPDR